ncbi:kinase-like protein [Neolentinus lepideus HHB14362 ss-1]|uniref:Kinase-like protein n=1 Tax=Neolentinus lepideus HHB14362 ss-1 TaxID=1314782 RepID=A0A165UUC1_9AGAM|nr:kinase-like protein [Neolentinus lepideus HHB14362 ss-1]
MAASSSGISSQSTLAKAHRLLVKLAEKSHSIPSKCYLTNIQVDRSSYPIGGGGFADVFQGRLGCEMVALKRLRVFANNMTVDQDRQMKRLCREALLWQQIRHPNILPFLSVDRESFPPQMCVVSPWMPNGDILGYLKRYEPAPTVGLINRLLYQIAQGATYLHHSNIVHGDLRGGNILIDTDHHVQIADFGLSVFAEATQGSVTCSNRDGSLAWMAPELFYPTKFGHQAFHRTPATDIYAFACFCIEVYTGRRPFVHLPVTAIILSIIQGVTPDRPEPETCRGLTIPDELWSLMECCWVSNSSNRPDIRNVARCLDEICQLKD